MASEANLGDLTKLPRGLVVTILSLLKNPIPILNTSKAFYSLRKEVLSMYLGKKYSFSASSLRQLDIAHFLTGNLCSSIVSFFCKMMKRNDAGVLHQDAVYFLFAVRIFDLLPTTARSFGCLLCQICEEVAVTAICRVSVIATENCPTWDAATSHSGSDSDSDAQITTQAEEALVWKDYPFSELPPTLLLDDCNCSCHSRYGNFFVESFDKFSFRHNPQFVYRVFLRYFVRFPTVLRDENIPYALRVVSTLLQLESKISRGVDLSRVLVYFTWVRDIDIFWRSEERTNQLLRVINELFALHIMNISLHGGTSFECVIAFIMDISISSLVTTISLGTPPFTPQVQERILYIIGYLARIANSICCCPAHSLSPIILHTLASTLQTFKAIPVDAAICLEARYSYTPLLKLLHLACYLNQPYSEERCSRVVRYIQDKHLNREFHDLLVVLPLKYYPRLSSWIKRSAEITPYFRKHSLRLVRLTRFYYISCNCYLVAATVAFFSYDHIFYNTGNGLNLYRRFLVVFTIVLGCLIAAIAMNSPLRNMKALRVRLPV